MNYNLLMFLIYLRKVENETLTEAFQEWASRKAIWALTRPCWHVGGVGSYNIICVIFCPLPPSHCLKCKE
jgi:hypothetical protein